MSVIFRRQKGVYGTTMIGSLSIITFLTALASAFVSTIWALFLNNYFHSDSMVGLIAGFLTFIGFLCFFVSIPIVERYSKSRLYISLVILSSLCYLALAFVSSAFFALLVASLLTITITIRITVFGIIVKDESNKSELSRNEGLIYSFANLAFVIGPLIAGLISLKYGFKPIFYIAAFFSLLSLFVFIPSKIKVKNKSRNIDKNVIINFKNYFNNKERVYAYLLGGGVNLWWALIFVYMPLYIINNGYTPEHVGYFIFAVCLPLLILEYHFAKYCGKFGFKKFFRIGYLIPAIAALLCFFISSPIYIMSILVLASIGLAMIEPTTEAYFFDVLKNKDEENRYYGSYNTSLEVGQFIGKVIPALFLLILPFKFIFIIFSISMFLFFLLSHKIKDVIEKNSYNPKQSL